MFKNGMCPVHPGEILREDDLIPIGMEAKALVRALHVGVEDGTSLGAVFRHRCAVLGGSANGLRSTRGGIWAGDAKRAG